jgi:hypothetical protein
MLKLKTRNVRLPTVLVPFGGPLIDDGAQDIFLYLRPESNGVLVESILFKVVRQNRLYREKCELVYLANIPGDFIIKNKIIEQHYHLKIHFARRGKKAFTPSMQQSFEKYFNMPFARSKIVGSFTALRILNLDYEELFKLWVPVYDLAIIHGQTIKRVNDLFIVNYDIPAILHRNSRKTDIATMLFRSYLSQQEFHHMVEDMRKLLVRERVIQADRPLARTFHYSRGPFEQILDGIGYLYSKDAQHLPLQSISFAHFLVKNGYHKHDILQIIRNPIVNFETDNGGIIEENIFSYTSEDTFAQALNKFKSVKR